MTEVSQMATQIVAVNTSQELTTKGTGAMHKHITEVKTAGGRVLTRAEVVSKVQDGSESFCTKVGDKEPLVIVVACPHCSNGSYIRTTEDSTTADNLLSLPPFTP
jgi:Protein of unknown function (DUF3892)